MKIYFISGLGADHRAFSKIKLPPGFEPVFLEWIPPQKNESLEHYAERFSRLVNTNEKFILAGLSFGGMLASEMAKIISPELVIIISSLSSKKELPWYFRAAGKLRLHKITPVSLIKTGTILNHFMGGSTADVRLIVKEYVQQSDPAFIRWALQAILNWKHQQRINKLVHVHGSDDRLLPAKFVKADYLVSKGGHLMVLNRYREVNNVLNKILSSAITEAIPG